MMVFTLRSLALTAASISLFSGKLLSETIPSLPPVTCKILPGGAFSLQWPTKQGQTYQLERSSTLKGSTWENVGTSSVGTGTPITFSAPREGKKMFYRLAVSMPKKNVTHIAVMGDSITEQGNSNLTYLSSLGYYCWARMLGGARWDLAQNGSTFRFATGGKRSDEVSAIHLAQVLASGAEACVVAYGTNDALQFHPATTFVNQAISDWAALRAGGIEPVAVTVLPMGSVGGANATQQALVAEYNVALRSAAAEHNVALCDWTTLLEATPGSNNGVGMNSYYLNSDNLHPKQYAASLLGRALNSTLEEHFTFGLKVWENANWLTPNVAFAGTGDVPNQWNVFSPSGGSIGAKSLVTSPEGNWWQLTISPGSSTGSFNVISFASNIGDSSAGKKVEAVAEVQVVSGSLDSLTLQISGGGLLAGDLITGARSGAQVIPSDGIVVLRTPAMISSNSTTIENCGLYFNTSETSAVVRIRRCGIRQVD